MSTPLDLILDHLDAVREAFAEGRGPKAAWERLGQTCPAVGAVEFNTFRTRAPLVLAVADRLHKDYAARLDKVTQERGALETAGAGVPQVTQAAMQPPRTFEGWSVQVGADGYTRLHKKIGGKVRSLYIGRGWNEGKARERIARVAQPAV
jgi:hypothetical protein